MATRDQGTATPPETTSAPSTPSKPSSQPTADPPKTTTDSKSSEATPTSVAPITATDKPTTDKPTTTTTMSTAEPPITNTGESPVATTTTNPPVTTTDPPVTTPPTTEPPVTTPPTTEPPVTATTTEPPVTATTTDHPVTNTTTDPPVTATTTTKDPPVTTTEVPPIKSTTTKDPPVRTTTTPPYTTRYVTTFSIVTVTTIVPETTIISGRGTTIYITRSTTSPVPTIIQDPTQEPAATQIDSSAKGGLQTWQITLIVVATLVIMGAVGAAVLVGRIKRERKKRDTMLFSDKPESVLGSEMGESGGGRSNRTLVVGGQQKHYHSGQIGGGSGWRERLSAWRPWDSHGGYHQQQQHPGGLEYNQGAGQGGGGGLWLMDESDPNYDRSVAVAGVDAAMRPVSYDTNGRLSGVGDTIVGEDDPHYYGNYPYTAQTQGRHYYQEEAAPATATAMVAAPRGVVGSLNPLDDLTNPSVQRGPSSAGTAATAMTSRSQQRHLQQQSSRGSLTGRISPSVGQLERLSTEEGSDYVDSHGPLRQSEDWTLSSVTSAGAGVGVSTGTGAIEDRTSIQVDPDQLESHAIYELVRNAPQAILDTSPPKAQESVRGESPTLPSAPLPPPSSTTAADTETVEIIADADTENNNTVSESHPTSITLLSVESTPVLKHASLDSEQQQQQPPQ